MKLQLGFLLVGLAMAELPTLHLANEDGIKRPEGGGGASAAALCPPTFPRYCPIGGFCCRTSKCCALSCCLESATYCYAGNCYR
ncbi:hypothetical protein E4U42_003140 [Claviceps africana]|uniref:Uncharacterized protein n=1 Tax=Claviceps africana TaxID=83212 RepID=A0A8K0NLT1_9HYPO|nr:hypothetical protein E4U42_003140 [Claviceps africana]